MYLVENQTTEQSVHEYKFLSKATEFTKGAEGTRGKPGKRNQYMYYDGTSQVFNYYSPS